MSATPAVYFHEDQHFRGSMLWGLTAIIVGVGIATVMAIVSARPDSPAAPLTIAILAGVIVLFAAARLETEVRDDAVYVHFHGLWPTRRIRLDEVVTFEARRYTMWESGGWGVHLTLAGMAYNVSGNDGVIFALKSGRQVLVGTQRPQEFAAGIAKALEARRPPH